LFSLNDDLNKAQNDLENARQFFNNIPASADNDLVDAAILNIKSAEKFLNYKLKQLK
jgi:hypothetical protein